MPRKPKHIDVWTKPDTYLEGMIRHLEKTVRDKLYFYYSNPSTGDLYNTPSVHKHAIHLKRSRAVMSNLSDVQFYFDFSWTAPSPLAAEFKAHVMCSVNMLRDTLYIEHACTSPFTPETYSDVVYRKLKMKYVSSVDHDYDKHYHGRYVQILCDEVVKSMDAVEKVWQQKPQQKYFVKLIDRRICQTLFDRCTSIHKRDPSDLVQAQRLSASECFTLGDIRKVLFNTSLNSTVCEKTTIQEMNTLVSDVNAKSTYGHVVFTLREFIKRKISEYDRVKPEYTAWA